jgi:hypothetical protein
MQDAQLDNPTALLVMLNLSAESQHMWPAEELAAILRHELQAPIHLALGAYSSEAGAILEKWPPENPPPGNLEDLLQQDHPSAELLKLIKKFAKSSNIDGAEAGLPREIALLLYFVSIGVARFRCQTRLSELPDQALINGLQWMLAQSWVVQPVRTVAGDALRYLDQSKNHEEY